MITFKKKKKGGKHSHHVGLSCEFIKFYICMGDPWLVLRLLLLFPFAAGYQRSAAAGGPFGGIKDTVE